MSDDELIEAMRQAYWDALAVDSNTSLDSFRAVLAVVRAHDRDGARRESALHLAVMSAVGQLNLSAPVATCLFGRGARDTLRQALVDYADVAMRAER